MTNEIKEILDYLKDKKGYAINEFGAHKELTPEENNKLLHYITNLQEKYDKSLELLANFNMPCEYDEVKISHNYCEEFCDTDDETYKKCWNKYIEIALRGDE